MLLILLVVLLLAAGQLCWLPPGPRSMARGEPAAQ